ncbi:hypothetical protein [Paenibacillus alba]|uniref:Uncharacterized protein n=1 Tax=Paenibacillus alba TaxID=1197127 RepID=A0ABU6G8W7_9BACL|nr:hypothetical protein [Paenibacillus alba]MEC0230615.1 hypothetical protein [Paenibacillus alba]
MKLHVKILLSFLVSAISAVSGGLLVFNGFVNGNQYAAEFSRPENQTSWSISGETIRAFTYSPVIFGSTLLLLAVIIFSIGWYFWMKEAS